MQMLKFSPSEKWPLRRDIADVIRVRYWYEGVRKRTALSTPYALERHFEPRSIHIRSSGKSCNPCKWNNYVSGFMTPRSHLVSVVEAVLPGSHQDILHPLWDVLKTNLSAETASDAFLRRLSPTTQKACEMPLKGSNSYLHLTAFGVREIHALEGIADLDALAALVWRLKVAIARKEDVIAGKLSRSIYKVLLMCGIWWQERGLAGWMLHLFVIRAMCLWAPKQLRFTMSITKLMHASAVLNLAVYHTELRGKVDIPWPKRVHVMRKLLGGSYGDDILQAMAPIYLPDPRQKHLSKDMFRRLLAKERLRKWGWRCVISNEPQKLPPSDIHHPSAFAQNLRIGLPRTSGTTGALLRIFSSESVD